MTFCCLCLNMKQTMLFVFCSFVSFFQWFIRPLFFFLDYRFCTIRRKTEKYPGKRPQAELGCGRTMYDNVDVNGDDDDDDDDHCESKEK